MSSRVSSRCGSPTSSTVSHSCPRSQSRMRGAMPVSLRANSACHFVVELIPPVLAEGQVAVAVVDGLVCVVGRQVILVAIRATDSCRTANPHGLARRVFVRIDDVITGDRGGHVSTRPRATLLKVWPFSACPQRQLLQRPCQSCSRPRSAVPGGRPTHVAAAHQFRQVPKRGATRDVGDLPNSPSFMGRAERTRTSWMRRGWVNAVVAAKICAGGRRPRKAIPRHPEGRGSQA